MIVDVHTHRWDSPLELGEGSARRLRAAGVPPWARPDASLYAHDLACEQVDYAFVLGILAPEIGATQGVERIARAVARQPEKYLGFPGIDPVTGRFLDQLDNAVALRMSGVTLCPAAQHFCPTDEKPMRLLAECARRGMPVVIHNGAHLDPRTHSESANPCLFDEVLHALPELHVVFTGVGWPHVDATLDLISRHANAWADLSEVGSNPAALAPVLQAAHTRGALNKLLLGSGFPFATPTQVIRNILMSHTLVRSAGITLEQLRGIVHRDTLACLGIPRPAPSSSTFDPHHHDHTPDPAAAASGKGEPA